MAADTQRVKQFRDLAERGDLQAFEQLWLDLVDSAPTDVETFLAAADVLESIGNRDKASLFLSTLASSLLEQSLHREALDILRQVAKISPHEHMLRENLLAAWRGVHGDNPKLETLIERSGLPETADFREAVRLLDIWLGFSPGDYIFHPAGWGAGRISEVDQDELTVLIDFEERKGHRMQMEMAAKVTETIEPNDLRAMRLDRAEELEEMAKEDPLELLRCGLRSRRGKATLRDLRDRLAGTVIEAKAWSRWWQKARQLAKAASDISLTPGSNPTLELGASADGGYTAACLRDLALTHDDGKRVRYLRDVMKEADAHEDGPQAIQRIAKALLGSNGTADDMELAPRISLAFVLSEVARKLEDFEVPEAMRIANVLSDHDEVINVLPDLPITGHRTSALLVMKGEIPEAEWPAFCERVILRGEADTSDAALADLTRLGEKDRIRRLIQAIVARYREFPVAFLWYMKICRSKKLPKDAPRESDVSLLEKAIILTGELEVANIRRKDAEKVKTLKGLMSAFVSKDYAIVRDAFTNATESEARSLGSLLRNCRSLKQDIHDRMLAAMFRTRPELGKRQDLNDDSVEGSNPIFDPAIIWCTEKALVRKRTEYEDVVNRQIPENAAEIGRAASYGDLSENAEWSAAIEKQTQLTKMSEELASDISKARLIDTKMVQGEEVGLGSKVGVRTPDGDERQFTILGPWEVDVARGVISYQSPLGRAMIGKKVGQEAVVEVPSGQVRYQVEKVEADPNVLGS